MFGNNMMGKLQEMQQKVEETKKRLDGITVSGEAYEGAIKVIMTGNREVKDIQIAENLLSDKDQLEDMLVLAMNRALDNANNVNEAEMRNAASGMMPPGMM